VNENPNIIVGLLLCACAIGVAMEELLTEVLKGIKANRTAPELLLELSEAFPPKKILGRLICEASTFNSSCCNTYVAYFHKISLLKNLRAHWNVPDLIELIVYSIHDSKVQECVTMRNFDSISDLIAYVDTIPKPCAVQ
jgi:hypothetical protein